MKTNLVLPLLLLFTALTNTQDLSRKGFFLQNKIRRSHTNEYMSILLPGIGDGGNGTEITTINGWHLNQHISLGLGISASSCINPTLTSYPVLQMNITILKKALKHCILLQI